MGRNTYENLATPACVVDYATLVRGAGIEVDWNVLGEEFRSTAFRVTATAVSAINATSITVVALVGSLSVGQVLTFTGGKTAKLTANAAPGATQIAVEALVAAIAVNDFASFIGSGLKRILAFTAMSPMTNGKFVPRSTTAVEATCFIVSNAEQGDDQFPGNDGLTGYGQIVGGVLNENLLPDAVVATGLIPAAYKTELKANGAGFVFQKYFDSRAV